jgi:hypothetical protein
MNAHSKPIRVIALEGIFELDSTGHYQRVDIFEEEPRWAYPGLIIGALCIMGWAAFIAAGYAAYRAVEALL